MKPYYEREGIRLFCGDNREVLPQLDMRVSAVVCDPPYGLSKEPDVAEVLTHWLAGDDYRHSGGGFMGRSWDSFVPGPATWRMVAATMLPGAHLLSFSGTRTMDLLGTALRLAGLEYRDTIARLHWLMGSGFPKSLAVDKAIDKLNGKHREDLRKFGAYIKSARLAAGLTAAEVNRQMGMPQGCGWWEGKGADDKWDLHLPSRETYVRLKDLLALDDSFDYLIEWAEAEREVIGDGQYAARRPRPGNGATIHMPANAPETAPATPEAERWQGWGTSLKPAHEDILVLRKPLSGTVAATVLAHGTGALNIDQCRVAASDGYEKAWDKPVRSNIGGPEPTMFQKGIQREVDLSANKPTAGRWPPNVLLDESAAADLDAMTEGKLHSAGHARPATRQCEPTGDIILKRAGDGHRYGDDTSSGASRFFPVLPIDDPDTLRFSYQAKAPRSQRWAAITCGCPGVAHHVAPVTELRGRDEGTCPDCGTAYTITSHPTQKPETLMRWIVTLVAPPGGIICDPFAGSGTTGVAAAQLGIPCVLIEQDPIYCAIAARRIDHALDERAAGKRWGNGTDASRAEGPRVNHPAGNKPGGASLNMSVKGMPQDAQPTVAQGRWPANVILDRESAALLDQQSGERGKSYGIERDTSKHGYDGGWNKRDGKVLGYGDTGGASRFMTVLDDGECAMGCHDVPDDGTPARPRQLSLMADGATDQARTLEEPCAEHPFGG